MKKLILLVVVLLSTSSVISHKCSDYEDIRTTIITNNSYKEELNKFLNAIALLESSDNYQAKRNNSQFLGRYQIGRDARKDIGMEHIPINTFLQDTLLQDSAMILLLQTNYRRLKPYILAYDGKRVGHHYVTTSGILAMAHSAGAGSVTKFFQTNGRYIPKDGNNIPMTHYLQFNNFNFNLN